MITNTRGCSSSSRAFAYQLCSRLSGRRRRRRHLVSPPRVECQIRPASPAMQACIGTWTFRVRRDRYLTSKCAELGPRYQSEKDDIAETETSEVPGSGSGPGPGHMDMAYLGIVCMQMSNKLHCSLVIRRFCQFHTSLPMLCVLCGICNRGTRQQVLEG